MKNKSKIKLYDIYYVYNIKSTMSEFCASFAVREHAEQWGKIVFGENAFISNRVLHTSNQVWNGKKYE